jgi:hypothetical protein
MNDLILNNVPSREQIERLQMEMSQMPREDLQLAADAMQTEHYFHAGMYARKLTPLPQGKLLPNSVKCLIFKMPNKPHTGKLVTVH